MKSRTRRHVLIGIIVFVAGFPWLSCKVQTQPDPAIFPATIRQDCAPWDGAAFTVSIPMEDGASLEISIWQSPHMDLPVSFSFPDRTGRVGNALLLPPVGSPEQLSGKVFFWRVDREGPVEGRFDLVTEEGLRIEGQFKAEWGNTAALCG